MSELSMPAGAPPPGENPALMALWRVLSALPPREINGVLSLFQVKQKVPGEKLASLLRAAQPEATDELIARQCGVSRRTLYRWKHYRQLKRTLRGLEASKRRAFDMPDDAEE